MAFLPRLNFLDQLKDGAIDRDKAFDDPECVPDLASVPWRKDCAQGWLG
jgi:hypothetical protein